MKWDQSCIEIIKETLLFKDIFYNIEISSVEDYESINLSCKGNTHKFHYFCEVSKYDNLKSIPCLGVYMSNGKFSYSNVRESIINKGENLKRAMFKFSSIEDYIRLNDHTLFLDTEGNVYDNVLFINNVCNIFNDNIDIKLFDYIRKRVSV